MRYKVNAYFFTNFAGLMDSLETDSFDEVEDFVYDQCRKGFNCEFYDTETGDRGFVYESEVMFNDN